MSFKIITHLDCRKKIKGIFTSLHDNFGPRCFKEKKLRVAVDFTEWKWAKQTDKNWGLSYGVISRMNQEYVSP